MTSKKKLQKKALLAGIERSLSLERALRAKGGAMFTSITVEVRRVRSAVSTTRIYGYEEALFNFDSKHTSRPGNQKAAEYIFQTFESFRYKPKYQWIPNRPMKKANFVAVLTGTENPDFHCVMSARYDSVAQGPGADDDSSSTAELLAAARVPAGKPMPASVIFAVLTGEESGLWGSREFARTAKEKGLKVMARLNNAIIGWMNGNRLDDAIRYSNAGIRDVEHAAAFGFTRLISYDTHYVKSTEAASLYDLWDDIMGGLGSYPLLGSLYYHQPSDPLETVNQQLGTEVAKFNIASIMLLASSPPPVKGMKVLKVGQRRDVVEVSWTSSPERGSTHYVMSWGPEWRSALGSKKVKVPRARINGLKSGEKWWVEVRAVNTRDLASWDKARIVVEAIGPAPDRQ